eukprot:TRINITY_DN33648_c0_g1_i1.p1 TRINITY_DN33648_c0_g1~~TRINITY_DN33648_c0_g1_i1.p1  ORF type:complete len:194 (-),score=14.21 TRINITY_DN33648_c0_g1_i1:149-730(-)
MMRRLKLETLSLREVCFISNTSVSNVPVLDLPSFTLPLFQLFSRKEFFFNCLFFFLFFLNYSFLRGEVEHEPRLLRHLRLCLSIDELQTKVFRQQVCFKSAAVSSKHWYFLEISRSLNVISGVFFEDTFPLKFRSGVLGIDFLTLLGISTIWKLPLFHSGSQQAKQSSINFIITIHPRRSPPQGRPREGIFFD